MMHLPYARFSGRLCRIASPVICLLLSGCAAVGVIASKVAPPETIHPEYTGLAGQSIAVMVWADSGLANDYPALQLDIGNAIQTQLQAAATNQKEKDAMKVLAGSTFPYPPASVIRYQNDHPEIEGLPITEIAPKLKVSRLIYIELEGFETRPEASVELYRGSISARMKIVEVQNGKAKVGYDQGGVKTSFPEKSPAEGLPGVGDKKIYLGAINAFGTSVVHRLVPYQVEP